MNFVLSPLDITIILGSLVFVIGVGLWASRKQSTTARAYFLASERLPWWIIGSAFVSTSVSSEQIVGLHKSQMDVSQRLLGKDYRDMLDERLKAAGERVGVPYAEAFRPCLAARRTPQGRLLP